MEILMLTTGQSYNVKVVKETKCYLWVSPTEGYYKGWTFQAYKKTGNISDDQHMLLTGHDKQN